LDDIVAAARRLAGRALVTPLLHDPGLDAQLGGTLYVKAEALQRTGSFKFRGACNRIAQLTDAERAGGVVAHSSGNHAQAVAAAAAEAGVAATIVMPSDSAAAYKTARTRALGATVVGYDRQTEDRAATAEAIARRTGATLVPPFDDPAIVAGQGTVGLEIANQCAAIGRLPDIVLAPCSGGGLVAGVATALRAKAPACAVHSVEPEGYDDTARSLAADERLANRGYPPTLCDALQSARPGALTFSINRELLSGGLVVTDEEVRAAMRLAAQTFKLVLEPGGAAALAALLARRIELGGRTAVVVASGGNIAPEAYARLIA
jgi:threonine dehydratase